MAGHQGTEGTTQVMQVQKITIVVMGCKVITLSPSAVRACCHKHDALCPVLL